MSNNFGGYRLVSSNLDPRDDYHDIRIVCEGGTHYVPQTIRWFHGDREIVHWELETRNDD